MNKKIKVAFIYHKSNVFLTGKHFDNTYYHFFMSALGRNQQIEMVYFATEDKFDTSILKNKFDVILLWVNNLHGMPAELIGIEKLEIPIIARCGDPKDAKNSIKLHKEWKIDYYFHFIHKDLFHEMGYPQNFKFKTIIFGLESSLYNNIIPFKLRIKNKILNSGNTGNLKPVSRIINKIKNPKWNNLSCYYLRTICNKLPYVDYTNTLQHEYVNDNYPLLLQKYAASIAAGTYTTPIKYLENPAAGCLTFMEITKKNRGEHLGYIDDETSIFINEKNYEQKFEEYLANPNDQKWERIANAGREFTLRNYTNDHAATSLVQLMMTLI